MSLNKTVLVLLDISSENEDILHAATMYAGLSGSSLTLYHSSPASINPNTAEDIKVKFENSISQLCSLLSVDISNKQVYIATENMSDGPLLKELLQSTELVVMGSGDNTSRNSKREKIINLVDTCYHPVLVIPKQGKFNRPRRILYCSSYQGMDSEKPLMDLKKLAKVFGSKVRLAHVKTHSGSPKENKIDQSRFEGKFLEPEVPYSYKLIKNRDVISGINHYIKKKGDNDLVVMIRRKHHIINRLFGPNFTHRMLDRIEIPLLILKENKMN